MNRAGRGRVAGALALGLVAASAGCGGVGRALVDTADRSEGVPLSDCSPVDCRAQLPAEPRLPARPELAHPTSAEARCIEPVPARCDAQGEPLPPGRPGPAPTCRRTLSLDRDASELATLGCGEVTLQSAAAGGGGIRLTGAHWRDVALTIEAAGAFELELSGSKLERIQLSLRGPVTLRVVDSDEVSDLDFVDGSAGARVDLRDTTAERVRFADGGAFVGRVTALRARLQAFYLSAGSVRFESTWLRDARIETELLELVDCRSERIALRAADLMFASTDLRELAVEQCGRLGAFASDIRRFDFPPCSDAPARLFATTLKDGMIDGAVVADDRSLFEQTRFGLREVTRVDLWDSRIADSVFCAGSELVSFSPGSSAYCTRCQEIDGSPVPLAACRTFDPPPPNEMCCPALTQTVRCDPNPERLHPPFD